MKAAVELPLPFQNPRFAIDVGTAVLSGQWEQRCAVEDLFNVYSGNYRAFHWQSDNQMADIWSPRSCMTIDPNLHGPTHVNCDAAPLFLEKPKRLVLRDTWAVGLAPVPVPQTVPLPDDARHALGIPGDVPPTGAQRLSTMVIKASKELSILETTNLGSSWEETHLIDHHPCSLRADKERSPNWRLDIGIHRAYRRGFYTHLRKKHQAYIESIGNYMSMSVADIVGTILLHTGDNLSIA